MKGKVLVTGASGFIGYHLIDGLLREGYEVYAAVRPSSDITQLKSFKLGYTNIDFTNVEAIKRDLEEKQYDYIVHAAGTTKAATEAEYNDINAGYTLNLAKAAAEANIQLKKFVFISSLAALGPRYYEDPVPIRELSLPLPITRYGKSKLLAEDHLKDIQLPLITLRPTAVYGPREKDIFLMFKTLSKGFEPYIGRKKQILTFVYVTDLVKAVVLAMQSNLVNKTYNLSDGKAYSRYALADITKKVLGKKTFKLHVPLPIVKVIAGTLEKMAGEKKTPALNVEKLQELTAENWNCSIENITKELGFAPVYDLEKGLTETLHWYKDNKWL
ncbi:NAD-dependent epimerase/dehydratase family protein [Taibaiella soli]|uniref:NAD(P)-dependent oxidoreductase n=1 Tax=Taibaiella soli TaxID=1649169 RepID=A0A2W2C1J4_9BACT|nr:NAD(P)-dependent oxidoreductase [Taibaiella soli]PZF73913.1 NAD(P)-dependent oxidoreductase [Taibaiella soli]